jgi:hypothetical protein
MFTISLRPAKKWLDTSARARALRSTIGGRQGSTFEMSSGGESTDRQLVIDFPATLP